MTIDANTQAIFLELIGKCCCRQRVGRGRSLSVGFGKKVPYPKPKMGDTFYGEWEIGTYSSAWRIIREGRVVCGSTDTVDSIDELDERLQAVKLGEVVSIEALSQFDIRVKLNNGVFIDCLCTFADDDEVFHILGPEGVYVEYKVPDGWKAGRGAPRIYS